MKKVFALILALSLVLASSLALADKITIAVPNDATNEGRALLLLQQYGVLTLNEEAGILATGKDIVSSKVEIELYEVEAANVPNVKDDVDYAIINSNYALDAGFNPTQDALLIEKESPYANVLTVKDGNQDTDEAKALAAALTSAKVKEYIEATYEGAVTLLWKSPATDLIPLWTMLLWQARPSPWLPAPPLMPRSSLWRLKSLRKRISSWKSLNSATMWCPILPWKTEKSSPTISPMFRIRKTSMPKTARTW